MSIGADFSCRAQGLDLFDLCLIVPLRLTQIIGTLGIQPKLRGVTEQWASWRPVGGHFAGNISLD